MPNLSLKPVRLALCAAILAGCAESPTKPLAETGPASVTLAADSSAATGARERGGERRDGAVLPRLLRQALKRVAGEQGKDAAEALARPIHELHQAARAAHEAGDREAAKQKLEEAALASAQVVVRVLGTEPVERVLAHGATRLREMAERIRAAEAQGRDATGAREGLERLTELFRAATDAAAAGEPARALVLGSRLASILDHVRDERREEHGGVLEVLLKQSLRKIAEAEGEDAAKAAAARLQALREEVAEARDGGDAAAVKAAVDAFQTAAANVIVGALGPAPAAKIVREAGEALKKAAERVRQAEAQGRDVARIRQALEAAAAVEKEAIQALADGDAAAALKLGSRVLHLLSRLAGG